MDDTKLTSKRLRKRLYLNKWRSKNRDKVRTSNAKWARNNRSACNAASSRYRKRNLDKMAAKMKLWRNKNGERCRRYRLGRFGITPEHWDKTFADQNNSCRICKSSEPNNPNGFWATDHCHKTGKFRAILCQDCNRMLGAAQDKISVLQEAIKYLEFFGATPRP